MAELLITKDVKSSGIVVLRRGEVIQGLQSGREWLVAMPDRLYGLALDSAEVAVVLTLLEAAQWLTARGFPRTAAAVRALLKRGRFPGAVKIRGLGPGGGGQWRVPVGDLEAWIATKEKRT